MDLYDELVALIDHLEEAGIKYALCGGIAVAFHGYARFTKDIDLLVRQEDVEHLKQSIEPQGFIFSTGVMPFGIGTDRRREIHRVSKIEGKDVLTLDLLIVNKALEPVWQGREVFEWLDRQIQVVSVEGLVAMKRMSGRDQDLLDIKMLGFAENDEPGGGHEES